MEIVSFEIAKKLKEKGFDKFCENGYFLKSGIEYSVPNDNSVLVSAIGEIIFNTECCWFEEEIEYGRDIIYAPTISQVLKWLREEKGIHICISCSIAPLANWEYETVEIDGVVFVNADDGYSTYEESALAGIKYILDNLI